MLNIRITPSLRDSLAKRAKAAGVTVSQFVRLKLGRATKQKAKS